MQMLQANSAKKTNRGCAIRHPENGVHRAGCVLDVAR